MKKTYLITLFGALLTIGMVSCSDDGNGGGNGDNDDQPGKIEMTSAQLVTVNKCNDFGFKMLKTVSQSEEFAGENLILSPVSFNYAFSMLANGAAGATRDKIINALGYEAAGIDEVNAINQKLTKQLRLLDPKVTLNFANSMWVKPDVSLNNKFVSTLATDYDAEAKTIYDATFVNDVNSWCASKTNNKIKEFMHVGDATPDFALFNAVYFNGLWSKYCKFDSKNTAEGYFRNAEGGRSAAEFMHQKILLVYNETATMQKCELNFGNTSFQAAFILPKEGVALNQAVDNLANGEWELLNQPGYVVEVDLSLPKFKIESEVEFIKYFGDLGMADVLGSDADFSNISNSDVNINFVKQVATFEIDEDGAVASTVTGTGGAASDGPTRPESVVMTFDRPFIYVVYEQSTGVILFAGCVNTFAK